MNHPEQETQNEEKISRGVGISIAIHAVIIGLFTLKTIFFEPEKIDFSQAIRVDMVALPDKIQPKDIGPVEQEEAKPQLPEKDKTPEKVAEQPKTENKPPAKVLPKEKKDPEAVNIEDVKSKQQSAIDKLKAMAALDRIKAEVQEESKKSGAGKAAAGGQKVKGNQVSPGSALSGLNKLQHEAYIANLDKHIKQHWSLPEWLSKRDLKAQVRVYIDGNGLVISRKIVKSSGNSSYDDEVLETIDRSVPFPQPPDKFLSLVESDGILIGFPE